MDIHEKPDDDFFPRYLESAEAAQDERRKKEAIERTEVPTASIGEGDKQGA